MFKDTQRRFVSWMAIAAILLSSLAPAITHAFAPRSGKIDFLLLVCSAQGSKTVSLTGTLKGPGQGESTQISEHCTFCILDLAHWGPPPQYGQEAVKPNDSLQLADATIPARPRTPWASPHSRAPPPLG